MLFGCSPSQDGIDDVMELRRRILDSKQCSFVADITADYGEYVYEFALACICDSSGNLSFSVLTPDTISGLKGVVGAGGGSLVFEDQVLAFPALTEQEISPVWAPMLMMQALRSGYVRAAGRDGDGIHVIIDDSYEGEALQADVCLDGNKNPITCELIWKGTRILSVNVESFLIA